MQQPIDFIIPLSESFSLELAQELQQTEKLLEIPYIQQTKKNWCWATCATMLSKFATQKELTICEAASKLIPEGRCCSATGECDRTCTVDEVKKLHKLLGMDSTHRGNSITFDEIHNQITLINSPIEVAFRWTGGGGHVAIVHGSDMLARTVHVNDPWPDRGSCVVNFDQLESAYGLGNWFDTWTDIKKADS
jgi:hypothetical protein